MAQSTSPYLRQHAHNPVFWYPWGKEALGRSRAENKPILLSIGYSTCYWCHVMEREVFENLSIASLMNRCFINIKVDREEHPALDEIYMIARQLLTHQGGWPNNVFLTPDLKPFYAGGTYGAAETQGRPAFPRLLEWLNSVWTTQQQDVLEVANSIVGRMQPYLVYTSPENPPKVDIGQEAGKLCALLKQNHDERSGGFFQAPKFPHECYHQFLLGFYETTGQVEALTMVTRSLSKMAAGGIYDHVGAGFHRYAVDKEWYVPHFEKMLYNQAQLARIYTEAARLTNNLYFADIARSVLHYVAGPLTDGNGAFYAGVDAETDGVEGAYYAWSAEQVSALLPQEEVGVITSFYALADIPEFPGHKHVDGQVLIARKPLDMAAHDENLTYEHAADMCAYVLNKLLEERNKRQPPRLDNKIIVSWNGLMIDAFAYAGKVFNHPGYIERARKAADFILEHVIDNQGQLKRIYAGGRPQLDATLEDYAFLIRGLLTLWEASPDQALLDAAISLAARVDDYFSDKASPAYFFTQAADDMLIRVKSVEDSAIPNANAVMAHNFITLFEITKDKTYRTKAEALIGFFLNGNERILVESCTIMHAALRLSALDGGKIVVAPATFDENAGALASPDDIATVSATLFPADAVPGEICELIITLDIKDGWHVNAHEVKQRFLIPTQVDAQGQGVEIISIAYPKPLRKTHGDEELLVYEGLINITAQIGLTEGEKRPPIKVMARFQLCHGTTCYAVRDVVVKV